MKHDYGATLCELFLGPDFSLIHVDAGWCYSAKKLELRRINILNTQ